MEELFKKPENLIILVVVLALLFFALKATKKFILKELCKPKTTLIIFAVLVFIYFAWNVNPQPPEPLPDLVEAEAIDGLRKQCVAQRSYFQQYGEMYNNTNDFKESRAYYRFSLIKYGKYKNIAPIYAEPKYPKYPTFVGVAVMSDAEGFYCLICKANPSHSVNLSKDFPIFKPDMIYCPSGYSLRQRIDDFR